MAINVLQLLTVLTIGANFALIFSFVLFKFTKYKNSNAANALCFFCFALLGFLSLPILLLLPVNHLSKYLFAVSIYAESLLPLSVLYTCFCVFTDSKIIPKFLHGLLFSTLATSFFHVVSTFYSSFAVFQKWNLSNINLAVMVIIHLSTLAFSAYLAWHGKSEDLVKSRALLRKWVLLIGCIALTAGIAGKLFKLESHSLHNPLMLAANLAIFCVLLFGHTVIGLYGTELLPQNKQNTQDLVQNSLQPAPAKALSTLALKIKHETEAKKLFAREGMTLATFAEALNSSENKIRECLNSELLYRNFNQFLNEHRVDEARRLLRDEAYAHEKIISIALQCGFSSLAPFNKHFKEICGCTPSEFKAQTSEKMNPQ